MKTMVDPPEGWRYGFPKEYTYTRNASLIDTDNDRLWIEWFRDNGYPDKLIDQGMLAYCRYWTE